MHKNNKRIAAAVLSLALGFSAAGAGIFAPVAGAQISAGQASTVDMDASVTLNIEKYVGLPTDEDPIQLPTLEGAEFKIQKISDIDLTTNAGWASIEGLNPTAGVGEPGAISADRLTDITTLTTDADGHASISTTPTNGFTVGVYLVTETAPDGYQGADPFIVTLPFTNEDGVWSYEQTVKPKNQQDEMATKEVQDEGVTLGSEVTYTISAPLPEGTPTSLVVTDELPAELTMDATQQGAVVVTSGNGTVTLTSGTDYTVDVDANNVLTVELTQAGLGQLSGDIAVTFQATIDSLPDDDSIENHASIDINDGDLTYETDPENPTETRLAQLTINKLDSNNALIEDEDLSAEFQLWRCEAEGDGHKVIGAPLSAAEDANDPDSVTDTFATVNGQAVLYGAQVLDWVNGAQVTDSTLCVVETKAPEGYSLNPAPQPVQFTEATDDNYAMVVDVINLTEDEAGGGQLPNTGGLGTMGLIAAGVVVAAAGGAASLRGNRARA